MVSNLNVRNMNTKSLAYGIVITLIVSTMMVIPFNAFAQTGLTISTDKSKYMSGETVTVNGNVARVTPGLPLTIQAINALGARFDLDQITPRDDGTFTWQFKLTGTESRLGPSGTWTVRAAYGDLQAETTFRFEAKMPVGIVVTIDDVDYNIDARLTNGRITDAIAEPNIATLTLMVSMDSDGQLTIKLPRTFLDSLTNGCSGSDDAFVILLDDQTEFPEEVNTRADRTLTIDVPMDTHEITIIGTCMIPEFGVLAAIVLAGAVSAIIIMTRRNMIPLRY